MKITVAKNAGFCFGVKRAYDLACVNSKQCDDVYILGKLVHNDDVCTDLQKKGVKEIESLSEIRNATIIFTAHGIGPKTYAKAQKRSLRIIDTTCPKVMKAQRLAKNFSEKGCQVVIFGDKKHKEVKSIKEWSGGKAQVVSGIDEAKKMKLDEKKTVCLLAQTTQNTRKFREIKEYLENKYRNFQYFNTICDSTEKRQKETRGLAEKNDVVIVIGGKDSANSKRLYEISKSINPKSYFVENEKQVKKSWFQNAKSAAISAGASTPDRVIKKVLLKLQSIS